MPTDKPAECPSEFQALRDRAEIQRAHDILVAIKCGDVPHPVPEQDALMTAALDALCWVLRHEHNETFARNLAMFEEEINSSGFALRFEPDGIEPRTRRRKVKPLSRPGEY